MQSWPNSGQNSSDGHAQQWQNNFSFANQNGQFDPQQPWSQPISDQDDYSHLNGQDAASSNFFHPSHADNGFLAGSLHGTPPPQPGFHAAHESIALNGQQYSQAGPDVIDPSFNGIHPNLYGQPGKMNLGDTMDHIPQVQGHPHSHGQGFAQHNYQFQPQTEQAFESPIQQFAQPHVIPQQNRQQSQTPTQNYEAVPEGYGHGHNFGRPPLQSPVHGQQGYGQNATFVPPVNGQPSQYAGAAHPHYQQQQQQQPSQQHQGQPQQPQQPNYAAAQSSYISPKPLSFATPAPNQPAQTYQQPAHHQASFPAASTPTNTTPDGQYGTSHSAVELEGGQAQSAPIESTKKRKRVSKAAAEIVVSEPVVAHADSPGSIESASKRSEEIDALIPPKPTPEEAQVIAQFAKRSKAAQSKYPSIKGLPHLVYENTIKLPAPKSYDKLAPLVALPPRSGRPIVPELGYDLPCEIQGRFTSRFRPLPENGGLDKRRIESKALLDDFDYSMKALGRRRPKYTEYPHAFKEQLKSDEATKNKAEKKAKKAEEEGDRNKPIRAPTRPLDPAEAAAWDTIGIVHIEPSTPRTSSLIAGRVQQAGDYIIKLRGEVNRVKQELDQSIKDKEPEARLAKLREESEQKREALYRALDAIVVHADDTVLDNLGGHQKLILSLVNALIMCIKSNDFSGKLPKVILELLTHFPMTKKIAETTNFETVRKRFADKGDDEIKASARQLSLMVKKMAKNPELETSTGYTGTSAASRAKIAPKPAAEGSSKRGRDDDSDSRTIKKIAVESTSGSLSRKLAQPKLQLQPASKVSAPKAATTSILPGKTRPVAKSVPRSDTPKVDGKTAADEKTKADTKNAAKAENAKSTATKSETRPPAPKMAPAPSSSALSGIASLLDSINAPKAEVPIAAPKEVKELDTPETPKEREKRLRKEARRKLRVTWKPESELVKVKIFHKEESEDEGREVNMIRDADDDRSEGMVLKQRADVEEDEDEDDIPYQPWVEPTPLDYARLAETAREKNYTTRGGRVTFSTEEQKRIAEREQRELMAIYADPSDIPPTPKSPLPEMVYDTESRVGHLPKDDAKFEEIQLRWRDEQQMGIDGSLYAAAKRPEAKANPSNRLDSILGRLQNVPSRSQSSRQAAPSIPASTDVGMPLVVGPRAAEQLLAMLQSDHVQKWQDPNPVDADAWRVHQYSEQNALFKMSAGAVEAVAKSLGGRPYPATSPPDWLKHDEERIREWWHGHNKEVAARQKKAEEERVRAQAEANALQASAANAISGQAPGNAQDWAAYYAQQQAYAPYMAILQQMTGGQQPAQQQTGATQGQQGEIEIPENQLQSILAAINQPGQQQHQPQQAAQQQGQPPNVTSYLNPNDPSYQQYMMLQQMSQGAPPPPPPPPPANNERTWDRDDDGYGRGDRDGKDARRKRGTLPPHKPVNKALIGTKPCTFWQQGKCARGDKCTFRHD